MTKSATQNFNNYRPNPPVKINPKFVWSALVFVVTLCANIGAGAWVASAYKADYDNRLKNAEKGVADLSNVSDRLSNMEGKMDTILRLLRSN